MRKILAVLVALAMLMPAALAAHTGDGVEITIDTESFAPLVWMCDSRVVLDDNVQPGRITNGGEEMLERTQNYAFEGEQISWRVLVMDKNGFEKLKDVYVTVSPEIVNPTDPTDPYLNYTEANCVLDHVLTTQETLEASCNARIDEEILESAPGDNIMAMYICTLTVESPVSMHGPMWATAVAEDLAENFGAMAENEFWFLNPTMMLTKSDNSIEFKNVRPGTQVYSKTIAVGNGADINNSGVLMDMFISGKDFTDPTHSGAKCPSTNQLSLSNFAYYAVNGAYSTHMDARADPEGYIGIQYGTEFNNPVLFYDRNEIMRTGVCTNGYCAGNILAPGAEMSITFRLSLPVPCNGDFSDGGIYFWGEAI